jgi:hypothetical protein
MKYVTQYNDRAHSLEEAKEMADGLRLLEGCIHAHAYGYSVAAHFDMDIPEEALPNGCRRVPVEVAEFLLRTESGERREP